jgi:hypothetical protein
LGMEEVLLIVGHWRKIASARLKSSDRNDGHVRIGRLLWQVNLEPIFRRCPISSETDHLVKPRSIHPWLSCLLCSILVLFGQLGRLDMRN